MVDGLLGAIFAELLIMAVRLLFGRLASWLAPGGAVAAAA
jgi:hypothetical protein